MRAARAGSDRWFHDNRVEEPSGHGENDPFELDDRWYGEQTQFEAFRDTNPFDRGHLSSRESLAWGADKEIARRNSDDSFHFSNCAPQHFKFNQGIGRLGFWRRLEEQAAAESGNTRMRIFSGPVFDAPRSMIGETGRVELVLNGPRVADPTFGNISIPTLFFKIIVWANEAGLRASGFVVSQEALLHLIGPRLKGLELVTADGHEATILTPEEHDLFQVPIARIGLLTDINFGVNVTRADCAGHLDEAFRIPDLHEAFILG